MARGKLEALITIPTGDLSFDVTETGGGGASATITLTAANTYYHSTAGSDTVDLAARLKALLDAGLNGTYTVSTDSSDGGTGKTTISVSGGGVSFFDVTWTDTEIRDILGYQGDLSNGTSYTSGDHALGLWLPDCPHEQPFGVDDEGWDEYDSANTQSPDGTVVSTVYNRRVANQLTWQAITASRTRTVDEATTNEAYQTFYKQCLTAASTGFTPGGPVRWYPDADVDGSSTEYRAALERRQAPNRLVQNWSGLYTIQSPRLVKVP
jgi:hypothetical protein